MRLFEITPENRDILNASMVNIRSLANGLETLSKHIENLLNTLNQKSIETAVLPPAKKLLNGANHVLSTTWFDNDLDLLNFLNRIKDSKEIIETILQNHNIKL